MKIIILGAGQVGSSVAENLAHEASDITVVDTDPKRLESLQVRMDIRTVQGEASHPDVLRRAGGEDADMILAVTNSDEINIVACHVAHLLFRTPTKIARVRAMDFFANPQLFGNDGFAIDFLISPEQLVTDYIQRLIEYPGALQVLDFAGGKVRLVAVKAYSDGPLVGKALKELPQHMPGIPTRVAAIFRRDTPLIPSGDTVIEADDEVFFIASKKHILAVMSEFGQLNERAKRIIIAGGGNIGKRLAQSLENKYQVKLIEHNPKRVTEVAAELRKTIVLQGHASDGELLKDENIANTDVFCALTNDDEDNIMSAMLAKRLKARRVLALINRTAYVDLVQSGTIDIALSPQQAMIGSLLAHIRRGDVAAVHSLRRGAAEAIEAVAHGDINSSRVVGRAIVDIRLPPGTTIGAIVRADEVLMAHHNTVIQSGDHVILFLIEKKYITEVERLFQVGITFL